MMCKQFSNPIENNASFDLIFLDTVNLINFNKHVEIKELLKQNRIIVAAQLMSHFLYLTVEAIIISLDCQNNENYKHLYQNQKMLFGNEAK